MVQRSWITHEFAKGDRCLDQMLPSDLRILASERDAYRQKLLDVGVCPDCLQIDDMDHDGPFSHCECGTGEDYAVRPLQKMQLMIRGLTNES